MLHSVLQRRLRPVRANFSFATPNFLIQENLPDMVDDAFERRIVDGRMPLPSQPGLGVTLRRDYLARRELLGEAAA
jgi:L-alanine-DL-glutamate epimerase-like enolase superfamily enzyme